MSESMGPVDITLLATKVFPRLIQDFEIRRLFGFPSGVCNPVSLIGDPETQREEDKPSKNDDSDTRGQLGMRNNYQKLEQTRDSFPSKFPGESVVYWDSRPLVSRIVRK